MEADDWGAIIGLFCIVGFLSVICWLLCAKILFS